MELIDDLIDIAAVYSAELVTYRLMTLSGSLAGRLYQSGLWQSKSMVETRGLVPDSLVVAGSWANYYRVVNKTHYGTLWVVENHATSPLGCVVTVVSDSPGGDGQPGIVAQLSDRNIYVRDESGDYTIIPFTVPLRQMAMGVGDAEHILLDERGGIHYISPDYEADLVSTNLVPMHPGPRDEPIASLRVYSDPDRPTTQLLLTRAGELRCLRRAVSAIDVAPIMAHDAAGLPARGWTQASGSVMLDRLGHLYQIDSITARLGSMVIKEIVFSLGPIMALAGTAEVNSGLVLGLSHRVEGIFGRKDQHGENELMVSRDRSLVWISTHNRHAIQPVVGFVGRVQYVNESLLYRTLVIVDES